MEQTNHAAGDSALPVPIQPAELSAIDIIRAETVLSKLPRHILSKSGRRPEIRIEKFTETGKLDLRWVVSFNELYGPARQLAYDLDTLIVERAIEETFKEAKRTGQPLPRLIPIGSLRDLCRKLNLEENGTNVSKIKRALQQNAGAVINTILSYEANDGTEFTIDGTFTCYGVFFTGKKLPDARRADQTYISTTNEYHQVISTAPTRPLDYDYKLKLPPTPRRLYEILSYPVYGALKNNQPFARLLYSDYCTRAPHVRYFTFDQVKKQMYTVNKPHKQEDYIIGVKYEPVRDAQGNPDWMMLYKPGPRAIAEFEAVHYGKKIKSFRTKPEDGRGESDRARGQQLRQRKVIVISKELQPGIRPEDLTSLTSRGVTEDQAREHLANLPATYPLLDTLEWADAEIAKNPAKWGNPAGWYVSLVKGRVGPPPTWETRAQRDARAAAERKRQEEREAEQDRLAAEEQAEEQMLDGLQAREPERYQALYRQCEEDLHREFPSMQRFGKPDSSLHIGTVRSRMKRLLKQQATPEQGTDAPDFLLKPVADLAIAKAPLITPDAEVHNTDAAASGTLPPAEEPAADVQREAAARNLGEVAEVAQAAPAQEPASNPATAAACIEPAAPAPEEPEPPEEESAP